MSSAENKRFLPIVDDGAEPIDVSIYSQSDVDFVPLAELYVRTCAQLKTAPNPIVLKQLPSAPRHHYRLMVLDCGGTYLGNVGAAALAPVVAACFRMTHLLLPRVGLKASGALTLLNVVRVHPGLTTLDLAHNDLGTTVGKAILRTAHEHQRISEVNLPETLVIQPIKRKIEAQLAKNYAIRETFSVPLIPSHPDDEDVKQRRRREEEERARAEREEQMKKELAERVPTWAPSALLQLSEVTHRYRHAMESVVALFDVSDVHARFVSPMSFCRAMRRAGIRSFESEAAELRSTEFADLFGAWRRSQNDIDFTAIIDALRRHATLELPPSSVAVLPCRLPRRLVDRLYDARDTLLRSFESLDPDDTKCVSAHELRVGLDAITAGCYPQETLAIAVALASSSRRLPTPPSVADINAHLIESRVNYIDFLQRLRCSDEPLPESSWMIKRSELRSMVCSD